MTKDVLVHITGLQADMDGEAIEMAVPGTYYLKDGKHYVFYEESQEGFAEVSKCQLRLQGTTCLEIIKKGLSNMHMVLDVGQRTSTIYATPYGQFELEISTEKLEISETEQEVHISAAYDMSAEGSLVTRSEIEIRIEAI